MPELPEVEAIRLALNPLITGKEICMVAFSPSRVIGKVDGEKIRKSLLGRKIAACLRRGKYLILQGGDFSLLLHFGMNGGLTFFPQAGPPGEHTHLVIGFSDRSQLHYKDPRTFGRVRLYGRLSLAKIPELGRLGADPWEEEIPLFYLEQALLRRKAPIKVVLMDQSLIAGIGNIYASEILFHAQIHPLRPACRLRREEVKGLHRAVHQVLKAAILKRGTSIISFRDAEGRRGGYQELLQVYGRDGEACPRCRTEIVKRHLAGRSTYFCPHCQGTDRKSKAPRLQGGACGARSGRLRRCATNRRRPSEARPATHEIGVDLSEDSAMNEEPLGRVLITSHIFGLTCPDVFQLLEREAIQYDLQRRPAGSWREQILIELLQGRQGIIAGVEEPLTRAVMEACPELRVISRLGVGMDNVDLSAATEQGIVVTTTLEANVNATADLTFALIMAVARKIPQLDRLMRDGQWQLVIADDVSEKTLGIIGLGRIGKAVARRASGFDMKVLAYDQVQDPQFAQAWGIRYVSLGDLLAASDFVTIHLSPSPATVKFIGEKELKQMKPTAFLINASRGIIVDEAALIRALQEGWIAGAALDVYEKEPLKEGPLLHLTNVVLTPHIGGATYPALRAMSARSAENVILVLKGIRPEGVVNPGVYGSKKD